MGFIRAQDLAGVASTLPLARGRGTHADELDAAFDTIVPLLSRPAYAALEAQAYERENPEPRESVVPIAELMSVAMLTTGTWGVYRPRAFDAAKLDLGAPHVSTDQLVARAKERGNPTPIFGKRGTFRDFDPFFARMQQLSAEISRVISIANTGYKRKGSGDGWIIELDRMQKAVQFVLAQQPVIAKGGIGTIFASNGLPFGLKWGIIAAKGNNKLPFAAYSELPMATCPGAGACGVYNLTNDGRLGGYCYSFKAWRYPQAFARQFLNTLASIADREFAIYAMTGPRGLPDSDDEATYNARVDASLKAMTMPGLRLWQQFVKGCIVASLKPSLFKPVGSRPQHVFARLYVDGDMQYEDTIIAWMNVCWNLTSEGSIGEDAQDLRREATKRGVRDFNTHIRFYGYTKCLQQFVNVAKSGYVWPQNYVANVSNNSVYQQDTPPDERLKSNRATAGTYEAQYKSYEITRAMLSLPITRGYFDVINLRTHVKELDAADPKSIKKPSDNILPYDFDENRVADFLKTTKVKNVAEARLVLGLHPDEKFDPRKPKRMSPNVPRERYEQLAVQREALRQYIAKIAQTPLVGSIIRNEVAKDKGYLSEMDYMEAMKSKYDKELERRFAIAKVEAQEAGITRFRKSKWMAGQYTELKVQPPTITQSLSKKAVQDKALSFLIHEALQAVRGSGHGSCPLVCGNCSDKPFGAPNGVHRCASKEAPPRGFAGVHIHIGLH